MKHDLFEYNNNCNSIKYKNTKCRPKINKK